MLSESSIVLLGNFNPVIFHPEWFDRFKILPSHETQWAEGEKPKITEVPFKDKKIVIQEVPAIMVRPDLAELQFPSITLRVNPTRFQCQTLEREKFNLVREVTTKIFTLLSHTPIEALGINFHGHCKFADDSDKILKSLFAKREESFQKIFEGGYQVEGQFVFQRRGQRGAVRFEVSKKMDGGIYIGSNFHSEIETHTADQVIQLIDENYEKDLEEVLTIVRNLIGEPKETWTFKTEKQQSLRS